MIYNCISHTLNCVKNKLAKDDNLTIYVYIIYCIVFFKYINSIYYFKCT